MLESSGAQHRDLPDPVDRLLGTEKQSIVATFKQATFLDYVYFTQLETSDPVTYGFANPSAALTGAYTQCTKFRRDGRESAPIPGTSNQFCDQIVFVGGDQIDGPLHTNDDLAVCGTPSFGRNAADVTEVSAPPSRLGPGNNCSGTPDFNGPFATNAPVLTPPTTNAIAEDHRRAQLHLHGPDHDHPERSNMTVTINTGHVIGPSRCPTDGVVYVQNGACCLLLLAVHRHLSGQLGLRQRDRAQQRHLLRPAHDRRRERRDHRRRHRRASSSADLLGLVANNFIRVKHPVCPVQQPRLLERHDRPPRQRRARATAGSTAPARTRTSRSTRRCSPSTTRSSSITTTAAPASAR